VFSRAANRFCLSIEGLPDLLLGQTVGTLASLLRLAGLAGLTFLFGDHARPPIPSVSREGDVLRGLKSSLCDNIQLDHGLMFDWPPKRPAMSARGL